MAPAPITANRNYLSWNLRPCMLIEMTSGVKAEEPVAKTTAHYWVAV
jgi:hypothetical protein